MKTRGFILDNSYRIFFMSHWVKCSLYNHENLKSDPTPPPAHIQKTGCGSIYLYINASRSRVEKVRSKTDLPASLASE